MGSRRVQAPVITHTLPDMGDTWGDDGPPQDAYERHSRDLAAVTAGFAAYLDELPTRLIAEYECELRQATAREVDWLRDGTSIEFDHAVALHPRSEDCATLLVGRCRFEGGTTVKIGFGLATTAPIPTCFCDACDEDSESLIAQTEEYVQVAAGGCREFRRPYQPPPGVDLLDGPWMEIGYEWAGGRSASANADVRGEPFVRDWREWPRRAEPR